MTVQRIPDGYHTLTPHLAVRGAAEAIDFYRRAFGAAEITRQAAPDGRLIHAALRIGDSVLMLVDEFPEHGGKSPAALGGSPITVHVYVQDVDAAFARAVEAGATVEMPLQDMFWGDRYGRLRDPFGHTWSIASHVEDLTPEEIARRTAAAFSGG